MSRPESGFSRVMCTANQGVDDMLWLLAQWLLLDPAKARHINIRYPVLRSWAWLRLGIAAEEDGDIVHVTQYNILKALDPDSFYAIGALAVRSELCTREAEWIIRPAQARDDEDSDESSNSSDPEQFDKSRASATKATIRKKKGKQRRL